MRIALVHNPKAGSGDVSAEELMQLLRRHGFEPVPLPGGDELPRAIRDAGVERVAIAGGDGTLRKSALALVGTHVVISPLPLGTANNVGKSLGATGSTEEIVAGWRSGHERKLDVGLAEGPWGKRHFLEGAGTGLIGRGISIIEDIDELREREFSDPEDKLLRDFCVYISLTHELSPIHIQLKVDGVDHSNDYLLLEALNIRHAGPRIELAGHADPCDGRLDVVYALSTERAKLRESLKSCLSGRPPDPKLASIRGSVVDISLRPREFRIDDDVAYEPDPESGEPVDRIDIRLSIVPGALRVWIPGQ